MILAALDGDAESLGIVIMHYQRYILTLSQVRVTNTNGDSHIQVDDSIRARLEAKLIHSILTGFSILPF